MANKKFLLVILVMALLFGMVVVGCGGGSGGFTLTDIPSQYNGKYALLVGVNIANPNLAYVGYQSFTGKDKNKLCRISNGRVSIPMWTVDSSSKINKYSGSAAKSWESGMATGGNSILDSIFGGLGDILGTGR